MIAVDGSKHAETAVRLVAGMRWPPGLRIRLVEVLPEPVDLWGVVPDEVIEAAMEDEMHGTLARAARLLASLGADLERVVARGGPAEEVLAQAESFEADLIVLGHRGRGRVIARLLGSVAAEVAERAKRPVLVARDDVIGSIVLADDGSPQARAARRILETWPAFEGTPIQVLNVAHVLAPIASGVTVGVHADASASYREELERAIASGATLAEQAAAELRASGRRSFGSAVAGDPAGEIVEAAGSMGLVVVGCRGHGRIEALLGTVSREVILRAPSSVLVVHAGAA